MECELTEEQISVQEGARDFTQGELLPGVIDRDREMQYPTEQVKMMGELGFLGMMVAPEYGGGGMDTLSYVLAMEEIRKVDSSCCEDVTMDGVVKYTGAANDRDPILVNIGGTRCRRT